MKISAILLVLGLSGLCSSCVGHQVSRGAVAEPPNKDTFDYVRDLITKLIDKLQSAQAEDQTKGQFCATERQQLAVQLQEAQAALDSKEKEIEAMGDGEGKEEAVVEYDQLSKELEQLRKQDNALAAQCITDSYEEKKRRREQTIAGLKDAYDILDSFPKQN
ncbi:unnamed protein product [Vitrella brassicaformis CCMP3155]|uniref:Uncharacterized protein n=1 Tax=Vitrella brassicaformis (strain CCMP3155) TaxID=1169540 RepID=A0A0G4GMB1_VITBC|nr:unnamed protein product [Vitrella brassicaformis CCMP3155]|mmetsp:Transcript_13185/g.31458  ORF Transcript_13185/g.31458 Transcript_13185/m.31458 type:complete len:162 (-) Transcript_13185:1029-1514(-)|eukprot:CEM31333.1 unnamed protein product [Vitrella brassicaformis CCMP3155]